MRAKLSGRRQATRPTGSRAQRRSPSQTKLGRHLRTRPGLDQARRRSPSQTKLGKHLRTRPVHPPAARGFHPKLHAGRDRIRPVGPGHPLHPLHPKGHLPGDAGRVLPVGPGQPLHPKGPGGDLSRRLGAYGLESAKMKVGRQFWRGHAEHRHLYQVLAHRRVRLLNHAWRAPSDGHRLHLHTWDVWHQPWRRYVIVASTGAVLWSFGCPLGACDSIVVACNSGNYDTAVALLETAVVEDRKVALAAPLPCSGPSCAVRTCEGPAPCPSVAPCQGPAPASHRSAGRPAPTSG